MAKAKKSTTTADKKTPKKAAPSAPSGRVAAAAAKKPAKKPVSIKPAKAKPSKAEATPVAAAPAPVHVVAAPEPAPPPAPVLTDEERALAEVYGDDLAPAAGAHAEFRDQRTADEDRPMMPEINARQERKKMWEDRRDHRGRRREERERERQARREARQGQAGGAAPAGGQAGGSPGASPVTSPVASGQGPRPQHQHGGQPRGDRPRDQRDGRPAPAASRPPIVTVAAAAVTTAAPADVVMPTGAGRIGNSAGDAAAALFGTLPHAQPIPVKQLAQMLRKRGMFEADPETYWPTLKAELLHDERSYRAVGLRPRVQYRGRDLFAPGPALASGSAAVERTLAAAIGQLHDYAVTALTTRIRTASASGFERLITAYLVATGYSDIGWVKRVDGISYASATAPGIGKQVLISARSGAEPVDRRGVGELRVGVEAKGLLAGVLFAAAPLSADAERELERGGRSITVVCADSLTRALIDAGVGVAMAPAQLRYLDDAMLDELLSGVA